MICVSSVKDVPEHKYYVAGIRYAKWSGTSYARICELYPSKGTCALYTVLVGCPTKKDVQKVCKSLTEAGYKRVRTYDRKPKVGSFSTTTYFSSHDSYLSREEQNAAR